MPKQRTTESQTSGIELMPVEDYAQLTPSEKEEIVEGHLALVATYGGRSTIGHILNAHSGVAGYGPLGAEDQLHRALHQNPEIPPVVV